MFTRYNYAALLTACSAITGVVSDSTTSTVVKALATEQNQFPKIATNAAALPSAAVHQRSPSKGFSSSIKKKSNGTSTAGKETKKGLRRRGDFTSDISESWLIILEVGTPGQKVELSLDLGDEFVKFHFRPVSSWPYKP
jgi:hypothetical protein